MPARICPSCKRPHNHTAVHCSTCYQYHRARGQRRTSRRRLPPPICAPGVCNNPATEARLVIVGLPDSGSTRDSGWIFLCPACAALFDQEEQRPITSIIPAQAAARGHVYC